MQFLSINNPKFPKRVINDVANMTSQEAQRIVPSTVTMVGAYGYFEGPMFIGSYVFVNENRQAFRIALRGMFDSLGNSINNGDLVLERFILPQKETLFNFINPFKCSLVVNGVFDVVQHSQHA